MALLVNVLGAAGIYAFEGGSGAIDGFGEAMWWTAMTLTDGELASGRQVAALRSEIAQLAQRVERLAQAVEQRG